MLLPAAGANVMPVPAAALEPNEYSAGSAGTGNTGLAYLTPSVSTISSASAMSAAKFTLGTEGLRVNINPGVRPPPVDENVSVPTPAVGDPAAGKLIAGSAA